MEELTPFVKWAGGKRQLLPEILKRMPRAFGRYYEPFAGGAAVALALRRPNATISDSNRALINAYEQIRDRPREFLEITKEYDAGLAEHGAEDYYSLRKRYNQKMFARQYDTEMAAMLVFLNKHCYNGLYRVNRKGFFNAPYNNSRRPSADEGNIMAVSEYLRLAQISCVDFEEACHGARAGDFVFLDSPYAPIKDTSFEAYTQGRFALEDHRRLAAMYDRLTERGCLCMMTNSVADLVWELYGGKGYRVETVKSRRMINRDASNRTGEETIICNY